MGTEITNYDKAYAEAAGQYATQDRSSEGSFLSTRGGILKLGEDAMPGNQVAVVILDSYLENAYFDGKFDPNNVVPPKCYAMSRGEPEEMQADIASMLRGQEYFEPQNWNGQSSPCHGCPKSQWGSSDTGRGKACKNQYRLTLLPAGIYQQSPNRRDWELSLIEDAAHYQSADTVQLKVPVTSGPIFERYRKLLRVQHARPTFGAVTRIYLLPDTRNQFTVNFELIELMPNELSATMFARNKEVVLTPFKGYEAPDPNKPTGAPRFGNVRR